MRSATLALSAVLLLAGLLAAPARAGDEPEPLDISAKVSQGALRVETAKGIVECPLKHTDVQAAISGFLARVKVVQTFHNPFKEKIEAVYVFPLPHSAAVDDMTMVVGDRRIKGVIEKRAAARRIYEAAVARGATAALLEQERPNIFTQSVGNIPPGGEVRIEISYVDVLAYDMGTYEFHFPMVVGPRFIPGTPRSGTAPTDPSQEGKVADPDTGKGPDDPKGTGTVPDTDRVPDASRITPPVVKPGFRTGHDIALKVTLDAGVPVQDLKVIAHKAAVLRDGPSRAEVTLDPGDAIPNKDFVLKYAVTGEKPELAVLAHAPEEGAGGYFMLMVQPRIEEALKKAPPRDVCFLIDVSGSMRGAPMNQVKQAMARFFELSKPEDRIQVITFAGATNNLFPSYVPATEENVKAAMDFTSRMSGGGGTYMLEGIRAVLAEPPDPKRVRIVIMLTDGYIGNEAEIIAEVGTRCGDKIRFWTLGIGNSVNRFLVDGVAKQGGGMGKVLTLREDPSALVSEIVERIHRAQLAGIRVDWGPFKTFERYPVEIPELWAGRPVIVYGRYRAGGTGAVTVSGDAEGEPITYPLTVTLPTHETRHDVLAKVWARKKIADLSDQMAGREVDELVDEITRVALEYRLMSQYTSFVAVDEKDLDAPRGPVNPPRRIAVPVPMPEGVSFEGVFGEAPGSEDRKAQDKFRSGARGDMPGFAGKPMAPPPAPSSPVPSPSPSPSPTASPTPAPTPTGGPMGGGGYGARPAGRRALERRSRTKELQKREESEEADYAGEAFGPVWQAFGSRSAALRERAQAALEKARECVKAGDHAGAVSSARLAYILETSFLRLQPYQRNGSDAAALEIVLSSLKARRESWVKESPALAKTLALVLENLDLSKALQALSSAAGVEIALDEAACADAAALLLQKGLRVPYLDLRGATLAEGLCWLLDPVNLEWAPAAGGKIAVTSARRADAVAPWVYSAGALYDAIPAETLKDAQKAAKAAEELRVRLDAALAKALGAPAKDGSPPFAVFVSPGMVAVFGSAAHHEAAQAALEEIPGQGEKFAKAVASLERLRRLRALDAASWSLLAGAAGGTLDREALAELREGFAGRSGAPEADAAVAVYRALFALTEAARLHGDAAENARAAVAAVGLAPEESVGGGLGAFYRALAIRNAAALGFIGAEEAKDAGAKALEAVRAEPESALRTACLAVLGAPGAEAKELLPAEGQPLDEDTLAVLALASNRAGGTLWEAFRKNRSSWVRASSLHGGLVVLLSRLEAAALPVQGN